MSPKLLELLEGDFPDAARRCASSAVSSAAAGRSARARARRERVVTQSSSGLPRIRPKAEPIEMPAEWRDDEITRKVSIPKE